MTLDAISALGRLMALGGELVPPAGGAARRKFDLAHMRALLEALGNPERRFPAVLIAGTNGKGSTAATLASIVASAGLRTGLYTSPHLERPNERIRVFEGGGAGREIADAELAARFEQVEAAAARLVDEGRLPHPPSFFETVTAIGFLHFAASAVELAVLEVGLGGRLDATNTVEPLFSVITDIALDHTEWLGDTLAAIAREKAGILRENGTLVTLPQHPEVNQTLGEVAVGLHVGGVNAADFLPGREIWPEIEERAGQRNRYTVALPEGGRLQVDSPLAGQHQQRNVALAIAAARELAGRGFAIPDAAIEEGIRRTEWPARLELLHVDGTAVLLDAAHNPAGAWALRAALSAIPQEGRRVLVFGVMFDKAVDEIGQILFPIFDEVVLTRVPGPRSAPVERLAEVAERTGSVYQVQESPEPAMEAAVKGGPGLVVVAGSVALTGRVRGLIAGRKRASAAGSAS